MQECRNYSYYRKMLVHFTGYVVRAYVVEVTSLLYALRENSSIMTPSIACICLFWRMFGLTGKVNGYYRKNEWL